MTPRPAADASTGRRSLFVVGKAGPSRLARHPNDGWQLADPYPLRDHERRVLRAVILAMCPPLPAPRSPELLEEVELGAGRMLRYMHPVVARAFVLGLLILDWLPLVTFASKRRLHRLDSNRASALLATWADSRIRALRLLILGARGVVLSVYFDQSDVHRALDYDPVGFMQGRIARRERLEEQPAVAPISIGRGPFRRAGPNSDRPEPAATSSRG